MQTDSEFKSDSYSDPMHLEKSGGYLGVLLILSLLLGSCHSIKQSRGTEIKNMEGLQKVENKAERFSIDYYGDYWFHSLKPGNTLNADRLFLQSLCKINSKNKLLYSGHTTLEPYGTSLGMLYKSTSMSDDLGKIKLDLRQRLMVENYSDTTAIVGSHSFEILSYSLQNKATQVHNQYLEYYISRETDFLRIIFWTTDSRGAEWLRIESQGIIFKLTFD